ncbi:hypothetical protein Tco_1422189 [Tanacetum coccineum]
MIVDNVTFQTNKNYLREFWSTVVAYEPSPLIDETEQRPLREFLIKFSVLNGQRPLTLDFNTFYPSTGLYYKNGKYVAPPTPEVLGENYSSTEQVNSIQQLIAYCLIAGTQGCDYTQDVKFGFLSGILRLPSTLNEGTRKSQPLPEGTTTNPKDSGGNVQPTDKRFPFTASNEGMAKTMPRLEGPLGDKDLEGNKPHADMKPINPTIADPSGTGAEYQPDLQTLQFTTVADIQAYLLSEDELAQESDEEEVFAAGDDMEEETQADEEEHQSPSPNKDKPEPSHSPATQESDSDSSSPDLNKFDNIYPLTGRHLIKYLRKVSRVLFSRITQEQ